MDWNASGQLSVFFAGVLNRAKCGSAAEAQARSALSLPDCRGTFRAGRRWSSSMSLVRAMLIQPAAPAPPAPLAAIDFDLARYRPAGDWTPGPHCDRADPLAITVCGRRSRGTYPLEEMALIFEPRPIRPETGITGNVRGDIHGESVALDRGAVSNRVMLRVGIPF